MLTNLCELNILHSKVPQTPETGYYLYTWFRNIRGADNHAWPL